MTNQRLLGATNISVPVVGFGTWQLGGISWVSPSEDECIALLKRAFDRGVTLFDVSPSYGNGRSETLVSKALQGQRSKILISGKIGVLEDGTYHGFWSERQLMESLEQSLRRLQTDYFDILSLHAPPMDVLKSGYALDLLHSLKSKGMVRFIGVSLEAQPVEALIALNYGIDILQMRFNLLFPELAKIFGTVSEKKVGLIINSPFAHGYLSDKYRSYEEIPDGDYPKGPFRATKPRELVNGMIRAVKPFRDYASAQGQSLPQAALRYILSHELVSAVVPGHRTVSELEDNLVSGESSAFPNEKIIQLNNIYADVMGRHSQTGSRNLVSV